MSLAKSAPERIMRRGLKIKKETEQSPLYLDFFHPIVHHLALDRSGKIHADGEEMRGGVKVGMYLVLLCQSPFQ